MDKNRVVNEYVDQVMKPVLDATGLPNCFYTSHEYFVAERDSIFSDNWSALMFTSQLPTKNRVKPIEFMGLPLLIVNDNDAIRIFHNVCRHRGHILVTKESVLPKAISCPYHHWTYSIDGRLVATPHIGGVDIHQADGFDKSQYGLIEINHDVFMNLVFININNNAQQLSDYLQPITNRWEEYLRASDYRIMIKGTDNSEWSSMVKCNWKLAIENYCEAYHLPFIHPELNSYSPLNKHYDINIGDNFSGPGTTNYSPAKTMVGGKHISLPRFKNWNNQKQLYGEYLAIYPNTLIGIQIDHAFVMLLTPINEQQTHEQLEIFYVDDGATGQVYQQCRNEIARNWEVVFNQDISPIENMQTGRQSSRFDGGHFSPALDRSTHNFHRWVASKFMLQ